MIYEGLLVLFNALVIMSPTLMAYKLKTDDRHTVFILNALLLVAVETITDRTFVVVLLQMISLYILFMYTGDDVEDE